MELNVGIRYVPMYVSFVSEYLYLISSYAKQPFKMLCFVHIHNITPVPRLTTEPKLSRAHHGKPALQYSPMALHCGCECPQVNSCPQKEDMHRHLVPHCLKSPAKKSLTPKTPASASIGAVMSVPMMLLAAVSQTYYLLLLPRL